MCKLMIVLLISGVLFGGYGRADSVCYMQPVGWKIFSSETPVSNFTVQGNLLWYSNEEGVFSFDKRRNTLQSYSDLGGISASDVSSMTVDAAGRVWIGGPEGVAVRDGGFKVYNEQNGLPASNVLSLVAQTSGPVWVGTEDGLAQYNNGNWVIFKTEDGLASNRIQALAVDSSGSVWAGTNRGISVYNGSNWTTYDMNNGLSWNDTRALAVDSREGTVWAAVGERDINCFNGENWRIFMQIEPDITSIMADTHSRIWFGTKNGLLRFNGQEWIDDSERFGFQVEQVSGMYRDSQGNLWYGIESGVLKFDNPYPF
ncbi:Sensor histidine kinase [Chitinispirillum alkaliphilum]|nr:Sensor histidine kinase [Chitinispirillum alkaliphilum]